MSNFDALQEAVQRRNATTINSEQLAKQITLWRRRRSSDARPGSRVCATIFWIF
jgi:hypothetical protein